MALLRLAEAARAAGVGRATLYRAIGKGTVSVQDTAAGKRIDTAELLRWRGRLDTPRTSGETSRGHPETSQQNTTDTSTVVELLKAENERLRADLEAERQERRQAEREHRDERQRLQEQIGRALLLLPAPAPNAGKNSGQTASGRRAKSPTPKPTTERTKASPALPEEPVGLADRLFGAVAALAGARPPARR